MADLKAKRLEAIDWQNLIEEVENLGKSDKRELESSLTTLFEHLLKLCYTNYVQDFRGWKGTIIRERRDLQKLIAQSPSLKSYWKEILASCYQEAIKSLEEDKDYDRFTFPPECPFPTDPDQVVK
ncbi:MAG: DUF29 domain-containing protein [Cyanobacteria bacterium M5B4]|nr:MAG: DUF29 domain-containing protein [Cyanobacteria bacterium M5B4]